MVVCVVHLLGDLMEILLVLIQVLAPVDGAELEHSGAAAHARDAAARLGLGAISAADGAAAHGHLGPRG